MIAKGILAELIVMEACHNLSGNQNCHGWLGLSSMQLKPKKVTDGCQVLYFQLEKPVD